MKAIGLIGGMSWESTVTYYQVINREVARRRGGLHSAALHIASLDFAEVAARQKTGDWKALGDLLAATALGLQRNGAECVLIGTNTMHCVAGEVQAALSVPLLHIADACGRAIVAAGCRRVALLGTLYTMEKRFYLDRLEEMGIGCIVPDEADRLEVHRIIFEELCRGDFNQASRARLVEIIGRQTARGAEGVILGCTEIPLNLSQADVAVPLFDTTRLHALAAVDFALA